ncbi:MAG: LacI family DNA-binding transcriptional regulator [Edaphobacter sp.]|uniref:LacI family DNA-binding transcriptional regulator n=1 Tax=Edaphobacter sp. TaxID=1934404 RepID=UPI002395A23E|nr:LacI family DNA-binding transcriptional regulator [Edaphobacter sp.]MDE1176028.1 LacI family DNA-binding transcriptional regulator [Edaphobacter sp.]
MHLLVRRGIVVVDKEFPYALHQIFLLEMNVQTEMNRHKNQIASSGPATIKDVAILSGVSVGSVSNVLNGRASVKPAVRNRIVAAIEQLDYRPNRRAQNLAKNSTPVLSFILSNRDLHDPFHSRILEGVSRRCDATDFYVLFSKLSYGPDLPIQNIPLPPAVRARGMAECVVLAGTNYPNLIEALEQRGVPYVVLANNLVGDKRESPVDQVRFDDTAAAQEATRYLIKMGHRDIWYIGDTSLPWFNHRYEGYRLAMQEKGLTPRAQTAAISDDRFINGFRYTSSILKEKHPLTAIFAGTDEIAYGCWEFLQQESISVPEQVSIIGFDDQRGPYKGLGLTTVRVEAETIGDRLAEMAINKVRHPERHYPEVVIPTQLVKRGTCQPPTSQRSTILTAGTRHQRARNKLPPKSAADLM